MSFNLWELELNKYFTEDEVCFIEILSVKNKVSVEDIMELKKDIQICQDCDSLNKIISTWEQLISKGIIRKSMINWKVFYETIKKN